MIGEALSLSLACVDVVWEDLKLGGLPEPFNVPSPGRTYEERRLVRDEVWRDLTERRLARRGRLEPDLQDSLTVLTRFDTAITLFGALDGGTVVRARASGNGRFGVVAQQLGDTFRIESVEPKKLVWAILDVLPEERPFPGRPVTLREAKPNASGFLQPANNASRDTEEAQRMFTMPRKRAGYFQVYGHDSRGRQTASGQLAWVDTESGRFMSIQKGNTSGKSTLHAPADKADLAAQLRDLVTWVHMDD